jgi:hypothetical protein
VARSKTFSHVILRVFSCLSSFFAEMVSHSVLPVVCCHRYQHANAINIHKSAERAAARERTKWRLQTKYPNAFNTMSGGVGVAWALEAMLAFELALDSMYAA